MMNAAMLVHKTFLVLFWIWTGSELLLQLFMRTRSRSGSIRDRGSLIILLPAIFCSVGFAMSYPEMHGIDMFHNAHWLRPLALALMIIGIIVRAAAIVALGRAFSTNVAIRSTQSLYTSGLFRIVRHPSYTGMLIIFLAVAIYSRNWLSFAVMLIVPTAALLYRIHVEESALASGFGAEYAAYRARTKWRLVPGIY
jgi:protein-S-isoprenylcysteine O-methyltransferase Ste14